ncbi:hypothetical protein JCM33374_g5050 [Metschnikowia sp. JCM 33374]|nr:hypothetical protein JCM33374_g5050 [Metschnikowia sp. JCM 33374]
MFSNHCNIHKKQRINPQDDHSFTLGLSPVLGIPQEPEFLPFQSNTDFSVSPDAGLFSVPSFSTYQDTSSPDRETRYAIPPTIDQCYSINSQQITWDAEELHPLPLVEPQEHTLSTDMPQAASDPLPLFQNTIDSKPPSTSPCSDILQVALNENGISVDLAASFSSSSGSISQDTSSSEIYPQPSSSFVPSADLPNAVSEDQDVQIGVESFANIVPLLKKVTKKNFEGVLVEVLKECPHVRTEDLYNLIYNDKCPDLGPPASGAALYQGPSSGSTESGLILCHLVVETFKNSKFPPCVDQFEDLQNPRLSSINFHELLRTFLAVKIISDTLEKVDISYPSEESVSRVSVYKVYYIICQKLITKYPSLSTSSTVQQTIILGQSKLGKLARSVFPKMKMKRLGRRGESLPHYLGFRWNKATVDDKILEMLDLDVSEIQDVFNDSRRRSRHKVSPNHISNGIVTQEKVTFHQNNEGCRKAKENPPELGKLPVYQKPLNTFVDFSCKYPGFDCSPRIWQSPPNSIPKQSKWAEDTMARSLGVLKDHNVYLEPLIANLNTGNYSDEDPHGLSNTVIESLKRLLAVSSSQETFFHFYVTILLLLFPVILSSDQEVASHLHTQVRTSVRNCVTKIGHGIVPLASVEKQDLKNFTGLLEKMIRLNEMGRTKIRCTSPESVINEIAKDVKDAGGHQTDPTNQLSALEESYLKVGMMSFKAYEFDVNKDIAGKSQLDNEAALVGIAQAFARSSMAFTERIKSITPSAKSYGVNDVTPDVPYQIFRLGVEIMHQFSLINPIIVQLPIPMINSMMTQISSEVQNSSFQEFGNRQSEVSREVFKSWWIFSTMFQEYMHIMGEVMALMPAFVLGVRCCSSSSKVKE